MTMDFEDTSKYSIPFEANELRALDRLLDETDFEELDSERDVELLESVQEKCREMRLWVDERQRKMVELLEEAGREA